MEISNQIKSSLFLISTEMIFIQIQHVYTYERSTRKAGAYQAGCLDMGKKAHKYGSLVVLVSLVASFVSFVWGSAGVEECRIGTLLVHKLVQDHTGTGGGHAYGKRYGV